MTRRITALLLALLLALSLTACGNPAQTVDTIEKTAQTVQQITEVLNDNRRGHRVCRSARFQSAGTCRRSFRRTGAGIRSGNRSRRTGRSRCRDARHRRRRRLYHEGRRRAVSAYLRTPALQLHHEEGSRKARLVRRVSRAVCPRQMHRRQPFRKL